MTRCSELLCLLALMISHTHATPIKHKRAPAAAEVLNFPCTGARWQDSDMTEVCKTMCFGINCIGFPAAMYWDKRDRKDPDDLAELNSRSKSAGCGSNNRCGKPPYSGKNYDCDEFPFKSIDQDRLEHAHIPSINRCVPQRQNKLQGNALRQFYRSEGTLYKNGGGLHNEEGFYKLAFQGYAGISYCEGASTRNCDNDDNIYTASGLATIPDPPQVDPPHQYFLTKRGVNLFIPAGADIGDTVRSHVFDDDAEEARMELDEIVALANATRIED